MTTLQKQTLEALEKKYPGFDQFAKPEQVLLAMAYLCDVKKVREVGGNNKGPYVDDFLKEANINFAAPWCAASLNWCCEMVGCPNPDKSDAAVIGWYRWAKANGRLRTQPARGRACLWLNGDGTGHIGIVSNFAPTKDTVFSIEGNTNDAGSREGDGMWRKERHKTKWHHYISLD